MAGPCDTSFGQIGIFSLKSVLWKVSLQHIKKILMYDALRRSDDIGRSTRCMATLVQDSLEI